MYEIDPASVFSSIVCPMTKLDGSQVSDRCPLGYLFMFIFVVHILLHVGAQGPIGL